MALCRDSQYDIKKAKSACYDSQIPFFEDHEHRKLQPVSSPVPFPFFNLKVGMKQEKKRSQKGKQKGKHKFQLFIFPFSEDFFPFNFPFPITKVIYKSS